MRADALQQRLAKADIVDDATAPADVRKAASEIAAYVAKTAGGALRIRTPEETSQSEGSIRLRIATPWQRRDTTRGRLHDSDERS